MDLDLAYGRRVYDWWGRHRRAYPFFTRLVLLGKGRKLRQRAVDAIGLRPGGAVLDLACGPGINFALLEGAIGTSGRLIGFDYSGQMLLAAESVAGAAGWQNTELIQGDAARMELPDGSLDGALCTMALSAIPDYETAIRKVHAALRPGARFAVLDAKPFEGMWRIFNPAIRPLFHYTTNWDPDRDVVGCIGRVFGGVEVQQFNARSAYVAIAAKQGTRESSIAARNG